jgi:hypothetical protein
MRGMKITVDAAMRARDVSRPRAENEALAQAGEAGEAADPKPAGPADPVPGGAARPGQGRRRRRGRNHGR